jgi:hypothetical protein
VSVYLSVRSNLITVASPENATAWWSDHRSPMTSPEPMSERITRLRRVHAEWTRRASELARNDRQEVALHWGEAVADLEQLIQKLERASARDLALI